MTSVIGVQALLFQDGGLLVMGANIFNMGILTAVIGFGLYRSVSGRSRGVRLALAGFASWLAVVASALVTALQLWLSGTTQLQIVVPAMLGVHVLIGLGEALITVAALAFIEQTRPDLLDQHAMTEKGGRGWVYVGILVSLLAILLSPLASLDPDGLNRVAMDLGFIHTAQSASGPLAGYTFPFLASVSASKIAAGVIGALVVLGLVVVIGQTLRNKDAANK